METGQPTVTRVVGRGADVLAAARARVRALRSASTAVLLPRDLRLDASTQVIATFAVAAEPSLAEITRGRALTLGECLTVGVAAARALADLHRAGMAHGDVSPSNVLAAGERVLLVDVLGLLDPREGGTPGFAAPERRQGAAPPGDVYALGATLRAVADAEAADVIEAWTAPLVREDPDSRPTAAHAALALARCAPLVPVRVYPPTVAQAIRASASGATVRRADARWWRLERAARRAAPAMCLTAIVLAAGATVVPDATAALARPAAEVSIPVDRLATIAPEAAAAELTRRRMDAMERSDAAALSALVTPGSEAEAATAAAILGFGAGTLDFEGLGVADISATTINRTGERATVRIGYTLSEYAVTRDGVRTHEPAASEDVMLVLRLTRHGWTVERTLPVP